MGASGWSYFVPYQEDVRLALQQLKEQVFAEGDHYPIAWYQYLLSHPINTDDDPEYQEEFRAELRTFLENAEKNPPKSIEELLERNGLDGTHSILDMTEGISEDFRWFSITRLPEESIVTIFGSDKPSRSQIEDRKKDLFLVLGRAYGLYLIAYENDQPSEIFFIGVSGD